MTKIVEFLAPQLTLSRDFWFIKSIDRSEDGYYYYLEIKTNEIPNVIRFAPPSIYTDSELEAYTMFTEYYAYHGVENPEQKRFEELFKIKPPASESHVMRFN